MAKTLEVIDGVECSVETGTGVITALDTSRRNWLAKIKADHVNLQKPVQGWIDPGKDGDLPIAELARSAHGDARRVAYRIVIRRKANQPTGVPLSEIPNDARIRDLVDLVVVGAQAGVPEGWSQPGEPDPDPAPGAAAAAQQAPAAPEAPTDDVAPDPAGGPEAAPEPSQAAAGSSDGKRGPRLAEPKPWEPYQVVAGGATVLNLGSYAVQAVEGVVLLAHDLLLAKAQVDARSEGHALVAPDPARIRALATRLLTAADRAQAAVRPDGHFDRMSSSHTRARAAVRAALEAHPVPWDHGGDPEVLRAWVDQLAAYATSILETVIGIVEPRS